MPLFHLLLVAIIQGLTEFLPISSSAHLILLPNLTGLDDQGLAIDIAVHLGTLGAVILYFRAEVAQALRGGRALLSGDRHSPSARLALGLICSTIPVVIAGAALAAFDLTEALRSIAVIGWAMLIFGLVLYWAERRGTALRSSSDWTLRDAWIMGFWQMLALIPGTSRSGIAITGALKLGYNRADAARLAMLMSIPVISASGILLGADVIAQGTAGAGRVIAIAAVFSFVAAIGALSLMMRLLKTVSYTPYVIYRVVLGLILLGIAYS